MKHYWVSEDGSAKSPITLQDLVKDLLAPKKVGKTIRNSTEAIGSLISLIGKSKTEKFAAIYLNPANKILKIRVVSTGTDNCTAVYPREIVRDCLKLHATGVIVAHNHPAGGLSPSAADIELTKHLQDALKTLEFRLLDHIILGHGYYSFLKAGKL